MGIRPLEIQSPISTVEWVGRKGSKTAKRIIMKVTASGRDPYITLPDDLYISDCGTSHAQLLMSRRLRSILPSTPASLQPVLVNPEFTQGRFEEQQEKQNIFNDRNGKTRAGISVGAHVRLRKNTMLPEHSRHRESRRTTVVQCSNEGRCRLQMHQSTSQETETLCWCCISHGCTWSTAMWDPEWTAISGYQSPRIPTMSSPNQPAEVTVADVSEVPSELNNLPLRQMYWNQYNAWKLHAGGEHNSSHRQPWLLLHASLLFFLAIHL